MALAWNEGLFPLASPEEIQRTKRMLVGYRRMKAIVEVLKERAVLTDKQREKLASFQSDIETIDGGVAALLDEELKRIMVLRFIKGQDHKAYTVTVARFSIMHETTVFRKINRGILVVANTIKMME